MKKLRLGVKLDCIYSNSNMLRPQKREKKCSVEDGVCVRSAQYTTMLYGWKNRTSSFYEPEPGRGRAQVPVRSERGSRKQILLTAVRPCGIAACAVRGLGGFLELVAMGGKKGLCWEDPNTK